VIDRRGIHGSWMDGADTRAFRPMADA